MRVCAGKGLLPHHIQGFFGCKGDTALFAMNKRKGLIPEGSSILGFDTFDGTYRADLGADAATYAVRGTGIVRGGDLFSGSSPHRGNGPISQGSTGRSAAST